MRIKFFLSALAVMFLAWLPLSSFAGTGVPFDKIVFFGDSLSDNGNLYAADLGSMPKSPPYFKGRFSNGPVWAEHVASYLKENFNVEASNYAVGGETVLFHNDTKHLVYKLSESILLYRTNTAFADRSTTLFVFWIGSNDYLNAPEDVSVVTAAVVAEMRENIKSLIDLGAKNFLILNVPDFSKTPGAHDTSDGVDHAPVLAALAAQHNQLLSAAMTDMQLAYPDVNINLYDINKLFDALLTDTDMFNARYSIKITNKMESCWNGGYSSSLRKQRAEIMLQQELDNYINGKARLSAAAHFAAKQFDSQSFAQSITASPALREAYRVGKAAEEGEVPCENPDEYIFWDHVHPTAVIHQVLAQNIIEFINQHYQHA